MHKRRLVEADLVGRVWLFTADFSYIKLVRGHFSLIFMLPDTKQQLSIQVSLNFVALDAVKHFLERGWISWHLNEVKAKQTVFLLFDWLRVHLLTRQVLCGEGSRVLVSE